MRKRIVVILSVLTLVLIHVSAHGELIPDYKVEEMLEEGIMLLGQGRYEESIIYFDMVLEISPANVEALSYKAAVLEYLGRSEEAADYLSRAMQIDPVYVESMLFQPSEEYAEYIAGSADDTDLTLSVYTERVRYTPGQSVVVLGTVESSSPPLPLPSSVLTVSNSSTGSAFNSGLEQVKVRIEVEQLSPAASEPDFPSVSAATIEDGEITNKKVPYKTSVFSSMNGYFQDAGLNLQYPGKYRITATANINGEAETSWTEFEVVDFWHTRAAMIMYVGMSAFAGLMIVIAMGIRIMPALRETLRFTLISIIAFVPVGMFVLTDVELGQQAPIGLVLKSTQDTAMPLDPLSAFPSNEWVINIGGYWNDFYASGIQIPVYVFMFGLAGGYIKYLHTIYRKWSKKGSWSVEETAGTNGEEKKREVFNQSIEDLALLMLSPLLAVASYFLLLQGGLEQGDYPTIAAVSFGAGLVTNEVIRRLSDIAGGESEKKPETPKQPLTRSD